MKNNISPPQLWLLHVGEETQGIVTATISQLSTSSLNKLNRLKSKPRRQQFILSRWLICTAFRSYLKTPFSYNDIEEVNYQLPNITNSTSSTFYSLSHSHQLIGVVIGNNPVGIDLEYTKPRKNKDELAKEILTGGELKKFNRSHKLSTFYQYWCRKEAIYKSLSLDKQKEFRLSTFDTTTIDHSCEQTFLDFFTPNYQLCTFLEKTPSVIDCHEINGQSFSQNASHSLPFIKPNWHFYTIDEIKS